MVSIIVRTIRTQLMATGMIKVMSWGAHQWIGIDENTLQFKVQGRHFQGHVRIEYSEGDDLYNIHFGHWKNCQWENISTVDEVYFDSMVDIIDQKVEYINHYQNR